MLFRSYKHFSKPENCSNLGFAAGFLLPGVASAGVLTAGLSVIAGAVGKCISRGNDLAGKISSAVVGLAAALKLFL